MCATHNNLYITNYSISFNIQASTNIYFNIHACLSPYFKHTFLHFHVLSIQLCDIIGYCQTYKYDTHTIIIYIHPHINDHINVYVFSLLLNELDFNIIKTRNHNQGSMPRDPCHIVDLDESFRTHVWTSKPELPRGPSTLKIRVGTNH